MDEQALVHDATGVVLAGGASMRMGKSKAALEIGGEPLLRRVVKRLALALPAVLVVGPSELADLVPSTPVVPDVLSAQGPLGGLYTALLTVATPWLFVVASDMPFVAPALVRAMARMAARVECDALVLRRGDRLEPLHAVYNMRCLLAVDTQLHAGVRSLHALLERVQTEEFPVHEAAQLDPDGLTAFNANTPEDWARALALV